MIYTFGCSVAKWYWPTWSDWIDVYRGPVINSAFKGYCNDNIYWELINKLDQINKDDQVIIMWTQSHRLGVWYDKNWIDQKDVLGFFPDTDGKLWYSESAPYIGMYRTHPDYQLSLTHMIISKLQLIYNTQLLLDTHGCDYTMLSVHNNFVDCRPIHTPAFKVTWDKKGFITEKERELGNAILKLQPVKNLVTRINWNKFVDQPKNLYDAASYTGMWEYYFNKKEYLIYSHDNDPHPMPLTHHDYAVEKILKQDPKKAKYRKFAEEFSKQAMSMHIPEFTQFDFVAPSDTPLLDKRFSEQINELRNY